MKELLIVKANVDRIFGIEKDTEIEKDELTSTRSRTKAFRRNAQPSEKSDVPRGLGKCPNKQNEQSGVQPDCSFLQNFMKFALLAKDLEEVSYRSSLLSAKECHITSLGRRSYRQR